MDILGGAEIDIFVPSFPDLQDTFHLSPFMVELTLSVNLVAHCLTALIVGNLGDRYGRRSIILLGLCIFIFGSIWCVLSAAYWQLLFGRFLQGVGISSPVVLSFVVLADKYSTEKQQQLLGVLNGVMTLAMAIAPVIGSYVNQFFGWRGNFFILLFHSIICLVLGFIVIPEGVKNPKVSLSLNEYKPILRSKKALYYILVIVFSLQAYWIFIGISPILYMKDLGVKLSEFGIYQGALAATFSVGSFGSGIFLRRFGQERCFFFSVYLIVIFVVLLLLLVLFDVRNPVVITAVMVIQSAGLTLPINILWPLMLASVRDAKGRLAAIQTSGRLIVTAASIQIASYFYDGRVQSVCLVMSFFMILTFWIGYKLFQIDKVFNQQNLNDSAAKNF
jgi:MFS transporter, DHA1 family, multidrug resistance protein